MVSMEGMFSLFQYGSSLHILRGAKIGKPFLWKQNILQRLFIVAMIEVEM